MSLACTALEFFFNITLGRNGFGDRVARILTPERLPVVLETQEVALLLAHARSLKDRAVLRVAGGCGQHVSGADPEPARMSGQRGLELQRRFCYRLNEDECREMLGVRFDPPRGVGRYALPLEMPRYRSAGVG